MQRLCFSPEPLKDDLLAGITVALVAIPQSLAYAQLAGVPAYYGWYAALVPTVIGALFGSSKQLFTGPVAMTSLLTAASVAPLADQGSDQFYAYVMLLALVSDLFQIAFGVMRMGILLNFLSHPLLMGFIHAAAIIIALSQLPALLGVRAKRSEHFLLGVIAVLKQAPLMHELSFIFAVTALLLLVAFKKYLPKWPAVTITVALLTTASYLLGFADKGGGVVGAIPEALPDFSLSAFDWQATMALVPAGEDDTASPP